MGEPQKSMETGLWVLPDGPNTQPRYLGCHGIATVTAPKGTNTLYYCKDPNSPNRYVVSAKTKGPPGLVTFTVETDVRQVRDYMEKLKCAAPVIATDVKVAPLKDFVNWERASVYLNADVTQKTRTNRVSKGDANDLQMMSFDMEADAEIELLPLSAYRDTNVTETTALNHVFACNFDTCASEFGQAQEHCDTFYAVGDAVAGSAAGTADVWIVSDGVWTAAAADPFATDEIIATGCCFPVGKETTRLLVFRGSTDPSNPAECAYSDDGGATWTTVNIGSDNGEFVSNAHSVFALDQYNIWVGTDSGRIYFSANGGATWTAQDNAGIHSGAWNWIEFLDELNGFAGGAADVLAVTVDGGTTWTQLTATGNGGDILCGAVLDAKRAWVGTDDGELFYTLNGGTTWTERTGWTGSGTGDVKDVKFFGHLVGLMSHNNATPKGNFFFTKDGGFTWEAITTSANTGVNSLLMCSPWLAYAVGEVQGSTAFVAKLQPIGG